MTIRAAVRDMMTVIAMMMLVGSGRAAWSAAPPPEAADQGKVGAWVTKAEQAAKKAAREASVAAKEAQNVLKRAGDKTADAAVRASRT